MNVCAYTCIYMCGQVDPQNYFDVTHVLVDPSCSGSGIVRRVEHPQHLAGVSLWVACDSKLSFVRWAHLFSAVATQTA